MNNNDNIKNRAIEEAQTHNIISKYGGHIDDAVSDIANYINKMAGQECINKSDSNIRSSILFCVKEILNNENTKEKN